MRSARVLVAVALAVALFGVAAGALVAQTSTTEVRIQAMRHDDGRVEFALQQREGDSWGDRLLPQRRYFPASGSGRWLASSPVGLSVAVTEDAQAAPDPFLATLQHYNGVRNSAHANRLLGTIDAEGWDEIDPLLQQLAESIRTRADLAVCDEARDWLAQAADWLALMAAWSALGDTDRAALTAQEEFKAWARAFNEWLQCTAPKPDDDAS